MGGVRPQVSRKIGLVYGGGSIGLMGLVAETVRAGGGHVTGLVFKAAIISASVCNNVSISSLLGTSQVAVLEDGMQN